ncbi:MAG: hypothetical protein JST16_01085 [Bdellovibrionales bacterium]|nr:hypothetical protein [Bdellovibrionales bacterium]
MQQVIFILLTIFILNIAVVTMNRNDRPAISILIQESRQRNYKTAKDYWNAHKDVLKVSYPHYSTVETGTAFPDIKLAIAISKTLKIELRHICHAWAKDSMPDPETKAFFEPIPGREEKGIPSAIKAQLDDYFIFTENHIPFLKAHPKAWDVMSFILAFAEGPWPTEAQVEAALGLNAEILQPILEWLRNEGLVISKDGKLLTRRKFFHLPNTEEFREIRNSNFTIASQDVVSKIAASEIKEKEAYRTVFMRRLTRHQANEICNHIDNLIGHFGNMPDTGQDFYALTVAFGSRAKFTGEEAS